MTLYYRPIVSFDPAPPKAAMPLAGGPAWFAHVEVLSRNCAPRIIAAHEVPGGTLARLCDQRAPIAGLALDRPKIMGILNVTPDSFSDGGRDDGPAQAVARARTMVADGADLLDVGGESTRPGADYVPEAEEIARTQPVMAALCSDAAAPVSIDTRKAGVARTALDAGARLVNDVSGLTHDPAMLPLCVARGAPVCVMHAQGDPVTMQDNPQYDDVLLDVYDFLATQLIVLEQAGIARSQVLVDPGIGFGKTQAHNLALLARVSLFHALGCPILIGASRKRFIGTLSGVTAADQRVIGSVAVALAAVAQGVQMLRVHDVAQTRQGLSVWLAIRDVR